MTDHPPLVLWDRPERVLLMNEMKDKIVAECISYIDSLTGTEFATEAQRNKAIDNKIRDLQREWCDEILSKYRSLAPFTPVLRQACVEFNFSIVYPGTLYFSLNNAAWQFIAGQHKRASP